MPDRRIVVESPDGRRVSVMESQFDDPRANPHNFAARVIEDTGREYDKLGRPADDHQSLKAEGFKAVAAIDPKTGHECPLGD